MSNKYLDLTGVEQLWRAVKTEDADVLTSAQNLVNGLSLIYDKNAKTLTLGGSTNENVSISSISVEDFVKDGILDSVEVVTSSIDNPIDGINDGTKFIKFTWNADSGKSVDYLKVSDFAQTYKESETIGIGEDNSLSVKQVEADKTKTSDVIPVAGGPLASLLNSAGITEIAEGTNMQDLFMSLFCKVEYPTSTKNTAGSMKCSLAEPSFTLSNSGTTVEVGTVCTLSEVTIPSAAVPAVNAFPTVSGFTYGYSADDDNTVDSLSTSIIGTLKEGTSPSLSEDNYTMKIDYTNFVYAEGDNAGKAAADYEVTSASSHTDVKYASNKLAVINGTNKVKVDITGPKAVGSFASIAPHYACSNTKKTRSGVEVGDGVYHKSTELSAVDNVKSTAFSSNTKSLSVTGAYKYFIGFYGDSTFGDKEYSSTSIRETDMKTSGFMNGKTINKTITVDAGTKGMYIAIPAGVDDTGASLNVIQTTALNTPVGGEMAENVRSLTLNCAGTATKEYKVFTWSFPGGTAGQETFSITSF